MRGVVVTRAQAEDIASLMLVCHAHTRYTHTRRVRACEFRQARVEGRGDKRESARRERERERERERDGERERESEKGRRDRQTDTHTHRQRERGREGLCLASCLAVWLSDCVRVWERHRQSEC